MPIVNRIANFHRELTEWRRELHKHPETAFEEVWTSEYIAKRLKSFGIEVHTGLAETGVVGVIKGQGNSSRTIALRADMDALDLVEANTFEYKSMNPGKMHGCGHDGHSTMLLGAAKYLAETRNFDGTVYLIFQPAEENEGGGKRMVEEGLFEKFPADNVWGMHNWPGLPVGTIAARSGPMMAAYDMFEINVEGIGGHGAMPHLGVDPVLVASQIVVALQSIASRNVNPMESIVVSTTQIHGGDAYNVIPQTVSLAGTCRAFNPDVHKIIEPRMKQICENTARAFGATATLRYEKRYPPTINAEAETEIAIKVAAEVCGPDNVVLDPEPSMGSEDFAFMLQAKPGSYVWIGNGPAGSGEQLHNPGYDFNDEILPIGASYWSRLVEMEMPRIEPSDK